MGTITTRAYRGADGCELVDVDRVVEALADGHDVVWIDLDDPDEADLGRLADELGLHHLAVEDAVGPHQRDKYVHYQDHRFLVAHAVELDDPTMDLRLTEFDVFIGEGWLVTVHCGGGSRVDEMLERWDQVRDLAGCHVGVAVYAILSVIVNGYLGIVDRFEEFYDEAADRVFAQDGFEESEHRRKFETRKALDHFTRKVDSLAEAAAAIVDGDLERYGAESAPYLIDVHLDLSRMVVELDSLGGLVGHLLDADMLLRDHRQNIVMKKVTSWAAIIAVPTLVTGYYGMNVPYPGEQQTWGVVASTTLAVGGSVALYMLFSRKRWL